MKTWFAIRRMVETTIVCQVVLKKRLSVRTITKYFNLVDQQSWSSFDEYVNLIHTINYVSFVIVL